MVVMVSSVLELALLMPIGEGNGKGVVRRKVETTTESGVVVGFLAHIPVCVYVCVCVCVCVSVNGFGVCPGRADWCDRFEVARLNRSEHLSWSNIRTWSLNDRLSYLSVSLKNINKKSNNSTSHQIRKCRRSTYKAISEDHTVFHCSSSFFSLIRMFWVNNNIRVKKNIIPVRGMRERLIPSSMAVTRLTEFCCSDLFPRLNRVLYEGVALGPHWRRVDPATTDRWSTIKSWPVWSSATDT